VFEKKMDYSDSDSNSRSSSVSSSGSKLTWAVLCRRGVDSVTATRLLLQQQQQQQEEEALTGGKRPEEPLIRNVTGGLTAWAAEVDASFQMY
jgi:rhodanese-related sulfurtransferase